MALAGLLNFFTTAATVATAAKGLAAVVNPEYNRTPLPRSALATIPGTYGYTTSAGPIVPMASYTTSAPITQSTYAGMLAPGGSKVPRWILDIALQYGPAVLQAVWQEYQKRRRSGQPAALAKVALQDAYPVSVKVLRRRRMNPANIKALRRAVRRVRSFQRTTSKVNRLLPHSRRHVHVYRGRRRRGDLSPFAAEDAADYVDTVEDLGYDPEPFREDDEE